MHQECHGKKDAEEFLQLKKENRLLKTRSLIQEYIMDASLARGECFSLCNETADEIIRIVLDENT